MSDITISKSHHRARKGDLELQVGIGQVNEDLAGHLIGLEGKVEVAVDRAIKKTARWLRTHSAREIGKELNIKQAAIKQRFRFTDTGKGFGRKATVWVGLLAIAAHEAGATVILLSDSDTIAPGVQADHQLTFSAQSPHHFGCLSGAMVILESLLSHLIDAGGKAAQTRIARYESLRQDSGVYWSGKRLPRAPTRPPE